MSLLDIDHIEEQSLYKYLGEIYVKIRKHKYSSYNANVVTEWIYRGIIGEITDDMVMVSQQYLGPKANGIDYILEHKWISRSHPDLSDKYVLYYQGMQVTPKLVQDLLIPEYSHVI